MIEKRRFTYKYTILDTFCDCEPRQILYNDQMLMLDMEDNIMIMIVYICIEVILSWIL